MKRISIKTIIDALKQVKAQSSSESKEWNEVIDCAIERLKDGNELAKITANYFGDEIIPPYLDGDLSLRDAARHLLGLPTIRPWREGDPQHQYEGHKLHCPKCGWEVDIKEGEA